MKQDSQELLIREFSDKIVRLIDQEYEFINSQGKEKSMHEVLKRIVSYENRKLESLRKHPRFEEKLEALRKKLGLSTRKGSADSTVMLLNHRFGPKHMQHQDFFNSMEFLLRKYRLPDDYAWYFSLSYYMLFGTLSSPEHLAQLCWMIPNTLNPVKLSDFAVCVNTLSSLANEEGFLQVVALERSRLGMRSPDFPDDIAHNHRKFYHLVDDYPRYLARNDILYRGLRELFSEYNYLNPANDLDYYLLFGYVVYGDDELSVESVKDYFGSGLVRVYSGETLMEQGGDLAGRIFLELPPYYGFSYLLDALSFIAFKVRELRESLALEDLREDYYVVEYSYEVEEQIRAANPEVRERELMGFVADRLNQLHCDQDFMWTKTSLSTARKKCKPLKEQFLLGKRLP